MHHTKVLAAVGWVSLFSLCLSGLAVPQLPIQEKESNSLPQATLKVSTVVVNIHSIVKDKRARLIPNLNKEDFELTEDHVPQQIRYFSREADSPLTLGIMIDTSLSQEQLLAVEKEQARAFIQRVLRPKDLAFVLRFDVEVELLQDLTSEQRLLGRVINKAVINEGGHPLLPESAAGKVGCESINKGTENLNLAVFAKGLDCNQTLNVDDCSPGGSAPCRCGSAFAPSLCHPSLPGGPRPIALRISNFRGAGFSVLTDC